MTNKKFTLAAIAAAAILGVVTTTAPVHAAGSNNTEIITKSVVKAGPKGTAVYKTPTSSKPFRYLPANTSWKSIGQQDNGILWYHLGGDQWVRGIDTAIPTSVKSSTKQQATGIFMVTASAANVRNAKGGLTGKTLKKGSEWNIFGTAKINGATYYSLGGNQYVAKSTGRLDLVSGPAYKQTGKIKISHVDSKAGLQVWTKSKARVKNANGTNKTLKLGSTWKIFEAKWTSDELYYNVGGNQWVDNQYVTLLK